MKPISITVTEAARNFADCINRARYQGATFILLKNGIPVARIVPEPGVGDQAPARVKEHAIAHQTRGTRR